MSEVRIAIADDHPIVRTGVRAIVEAQADLTVVAEAGDYPSALRLPYAHDLDVLLLDIDMPGGAILSALDHLRTSHPEVSVVVLTMHEENELAVRVLRAGAMGFLVKGRAPADVVSAIRRVARGERVISPGLTELLLAQVDGDGPPHSRLSQREFQVFIRLARGERPTDIAAALHLSVKTISTHKSRLLNKMGLCSVAELTRYALEHRLL